MILGFFFGRYRRFFFGIFFIVFVVEFFVVIYFREGVFFVFDRNVVGLSRFFFLLRIGLGFEMWSVVLRERFCKFRGSIFFVSLRIKEVLLGDFSLYVVFRRIVVIFYFWRASCLLCS